jgi:hypothetical protein
VRVRSENLLVSSVPEPRRESRLGLWFLLVLVATTIAAPPVMRGVEFASRGIKIDQLLLLPALYAGLIVAPRRLLAAARTPVGAALAAFAAASAFSSVWAILLVPRVNAGAAVAAAWGSTRPVIVFVISYALALRMAPAARLRVVGFVVVLALINVAVAAAQVMRWEPIYSFTVDYYTRKSAFEDILGGLDMGRAYGTFDGQPNVFGAFTVLTLALTGAMLLHAGTPRKRAILIAALGCMTWGLAISWSRGSYAGALAVAAVLLWHAGRRRGAKLVILAVVMGVCTYAVLPELPRERILQLLEGRGYGGESIHLSRMPFWAANLELFLESPLLGVRGVQTAPLDSLYVGLLVVNGLLGSVIFGVVLWMLARSLRQCDAGAMRPICIGLSAATVGWLVNGISIPVFFGERIQEVFWLIAGVALARPLQPLGDIAASRNSTHVAVRPRSPSHFAGSDIAVNRRE